MAKISQRAGNKHAIHLNIETSVSSNLSRLATRLTERLFPEGPPPNLTMEDFIETVVGLLDEDLDAFKAADRLVAKEVSDDAMKRHLRDEAIGTLRQTIMNGRTAVELTWGRRAVNRLGLRGNTPESPGPLITFAQNVLKQLDDGLGGFDIKSKLAIPDLSQFAAALEEQIEAVDDAVRAVNLDVRETQDAQNERNKAADTWNNDYVPVASIVENLFRLAEMPAHAERVRPTSRRRAGLAEDEDLELLDDDDIDVIDFDTDSDTQDEESDVVTT